MKKLVLAFSVFALVYSCSPDEIEKPREFEIKLERLEATTPKDSLNEPNANPVPATEDIDKDEIEPGDV